MMVGHSMLAFALAAAGARLLGWPADRALRVGAVAGAFALVPDADMVYAVTGVVGADMSGPFVLTNAFWGASTEVHRSATHSLVLGVPAAVGFALWTVGGRAARLGSAGLLSALVVVSYLASGPLDAFAVVAFAVVGVGVATAVERSATLPPAAVLGTALVGLLSHPFGDLFTGSAPVLFYPLDVRALDGIVTLHSNATLHLLGAFGLELATVWLAGAVYLRLTGTPAGAAIDRRALLGVCYGPAAVLLPPPTLAVSYHFVFSILGVGVLLGTPALRDLDVGSVVRGGVPAETDGGVDGGSAADDPAGTDAGSESTDPDGSRGPGRSVVPSVVLTVTAAVTAAWAAYLAVYLLA